MTLQLYRGTTQSHKLYIVNELERFFFHATAKVDNTFRASLHIQAVRRKGKLLKFKHRLPPVHHHFRQAD
jgi:hypothetical protein